MNATSDAHGPCSVIVGTDVLEVLDEEPLGLAGHPQRGEQDGQALTWVHGPIGEPATSCSRSCAPQQRERLGDPPLGPGHRSQARERAAIDVSSAGDAIPARIATAGSRTAVNSS